MNWIASVHLTLLVNGNPGPLGLIVNELHVPESSRCLGWRERRGGGGGGEKAK